MGIISVGAFGVVYGGTWRHTKIAFKQIVGNNALTSQGEEDFLVREMLVSPNSNLQQAEANLLKSLRPHRSIIAFYGICVDPLGIVTAFAENGSLSHYIEEGRKLDKQTVLRMAMEVASGMEHLHSEGVIHRDLAAR